MPTRNVVLLVVPLLAGCLWLPGIRGVRPGIGLERVERSPAGGAAGGRASLAAEPGARGYLFEDSLIAFRTRAGLALVRFRLWNKGPEPLRVTWPDAGPTARLAPACPDSAGGWELRSPRPRPPAATVEPGGSREEHAVPVARVATARGEAWRRARMLCLVFEPAEPPAALRLVVETPGGRYLYTFWYRLMEAPRMDEAAPARP